MPVVETTPNPSNPSEPFAAARVHWERARAARRTQVEALEDARLTLGVLSNPSGEGERRSPLVEARARRYLGGRRPDADRVAREVRGLEERVADGAEAFQAERDRWQGALAAERARLEAVSLPGRRSAVAKIGRLVEALSREIATARAAQAGLADLGVLASDPGVHLGSLEEWHSALSRWRQGMQQAGLL